MKGDDISERLRGFAVRVIRLAGALPKDFAGEHIGRQLLRSGTSVGANYEEARTAESRSDFVHKLKIALKELRESSYWLKVIRDTELLAVERLEGIIQESLELSNILGKSIVTTKQNAKRSS